MARHGARGSIVLIVFGRVTTRRTCTVIPGLESHKINESHDGPRYEYEACSDLFSNCASAKQHMYNKDHWRKHYYQPCGKGLESERNSNAQLNGRTHCGSSMPCPFSKRGLTTSTGFTHHSKVRPCPHARALNREKIQEEKEINRRDAESHTTKKVLTFLDES
ncbi:hypothetical protein IQ06DRAFT_144759 [Phaeosphaeriaceae sp. SRC1lsM3a]|nr:hypothetical protein IQ06DRAFT_144759 [Stagonospora sp. SRC1lsM3a]